MPWPRSQASAPGPLTPSFGRALTSHNPSTLAAAASSSGGPRRSATGAPASRPQAVVGVCSRWWTGLWRWAGAGMASLLAAVVGVVEGQSDHLRLGEGRAGLDP